MIAGQKKGAGRSPQPQMHNRPKYEPMNQLPGSSFKQEFLQTDSSHYQAPRERPNTQNHNSVYLPYKYTASNQLSQRTQSNTQILQGNILNYLDAIHGGSRGNRTDNEEYQGNQIEEHQGTKREESNSSRDGNSVFPESNQQKLVSPRSNSIQEQEFVSNERISNEQQDSSQPSSARRERNQVYPIRENQSRAGALDQYIHEEIKRKQPEYRQPSQKDYYNESDTGSDNDNDDRYDYDDDEEDEDDDDYNQRDESQPIRVRLDLSAFAKSLQKSIDQISSINENRSPLYQPNFYQNAGAQKAMNNLGSDNNIHTTPAYYEDCKQEIESSGPKSRREKQMRQDPESDEYYPSDNRRQIIRKDQDEVDYYNSRSEYDNHKQGKLVRRPNGIRLEDDANIIRKVQQDILLLSNKMNESLSPSYGKDFSEALRRKRNLDF